MEKEKSVKEENPMKGYDPTDRNFQKADSEDTDEDKLRDKDKKNTDNNKKEDTAGIP